MGDFNEMRKLSEKERLKLKKKAELRQQLSKAKGQGAKELKSM